MRTLLTSPAYFRLEKIVQFEKQIRIVVKTTQHDILCPRRQTSASKQHSRYQRSVADLPWEGIAVRIELQARKFFCLNPECEQRVFCERLPGVVAPYGRRILRLDEGLTLFGLALGGEAGARAAVGLDFPGSGDTLLRLVRKDAATQDIEVRVLGVDDWAKRKGHSYGTILVDLERRRVIDLLPDRESTTLEKWLKQHSEVEIISRDRAPAYADGAKRGAPQAEQVADRWHLLKNLGDALERYLQRRHQVLHQAATEARKSQEATVVMEKAERAFEPSTAETLTQAQRDGESRRNQRLERYGEIRRLHQQGFSQLEIGRKVGLSRVTVRKFIQAEIFPERAARAKAASKIDPFMEKIKERWASGCHNAAEIWRELSAQGFAGTSDLVRRCVREWRAELPPSLRRTTGSVSNAIEKIKTPAPRRTACLLMRDDQELDESEREIVSRIIQLSPEIKMAQHLGQKFQQLVRGRESDKLDGWREEVAVSGISELRAFADGLMNDEAAVRAALRSEWSNGQTEGQVNRLKMLKRQMYGRAKFDLLRARVLHPV